MQKSAAHFGLLLKVMPFGKTKELQLLELLHLRVKMEQLFPLLEQQTDNLVQYFVTQS